MLAHDRRVLDVPLEERLQSRMSNLIAWAKTMLTVINLSIRDARAQLHTGDQDSDTTVVEPTTTRTPATIIPTTNTAVTLSRLLDIRMQEPSSLQFQLPVGVPLSFPRMISPTISMY
jgi:hypothetical protein